MNNTEFPKDSGPALENAECVEDVAYDPEQIARLETALRALSRLDREMFLAERLDRMSFGDIAQRTGLSVRQVERHYARTIYRLSLMMDGVPPRWWWRWF